MIEKPHAGLLRFIVAKYFFKEYCPQVINWSRKISGKNGRGNPIEFSAEDKKMILAGIDELMADIKNELKQLI